MKILIAPDSFKGSLTALEVAHSISKGIKRFDKRIETVIVPMADGGEGTVQSLVDATQGQIHKVKVLDPLQREIESFYGVLGDQKTAVVEMAAASGLPLLSINERNPLNTSTYGTGQLIKNALNIGCTKFILGLGGSATNDGGCGMAQALGAKFYDINGNELMMCGRTLSKIHSIDLTYLDERIKNATFLAACDVSNPLCGSNGAAEVYGRQKGASENDILLLDRGLLHFANLLGKQLGMSVIDVPGAGAAGGLGAGVIGFLNAKLQSGIDIVTDTVKLTEKIVVADLVITGEGSIDFQTAYGKTPYGVALLAKKYKIPVVVLAGSLGKGYESLYNNCFDGIFSIIDKPMTLQNAFDNAPQLLEHAAENILRFWKTINK